MKISTLLQMDVCTTMTYPVLYVQDPCYTQAKPLSYYAIIFIVGHL